MIPILFDANTQNFTTNGLGRLTDIISCEVREQRNGEFEVEFKYPVVGTHYEQVTEGKIIYVDHDHTGDKQPFTIYRRSLPFNGIVTFYAHHVSYKLNGTIVAPFTASSIGAAFTNFNAKAITENPFTFWTDKASAGNFSVKVPTAIRPLLGGTQGSILDAFGGGEYEFDNYTVRLYAHRGTDKGVTIRYGKNLTDLKETIDTLDLYNSVIPFWQKEDEVVYGGIVKSSSGYQQNAYWTNNAGVQFTDEDGEPITFTYTIGNTKPLDLSQEFETAPTVDQLEARAAAYLTSNTPWIPKVNLDIDFVALWQTEEYKDVAPLERVALCDTVSVYYPAFGVNAKAKVIKTVWDARTGRYSKMELGDAKTSFAKVIEQTTDVKLAEKPSISMMDTAISHATEQITGALGGHLIFNYDADGKPTELLIMDTDDVNTAVNVWRFNEGGLGHSHNGYNGPFDDIALTQDGQINASMITAGILNASIIQAGILRSHNWLSYWDLESSEFRFYDEENDSVVVLDRGVIKFYTGETEVGAVSRRLAGAEEVVTLESTAGNNGLAVGENKIWLNATTSSWFHATADYAQIKTGDAYVRTQDDSDGQGVRIEGGENTFLLVDATNDRVYFKAGDLMVNGYTGYTGTVTISGKSLLFKNGICYSVT